MSKLPPARWWAVRRAANRKPTTYRCPICGELLPALTEHMLIAPEGDFKRRRHAHTACVLAARRDGRLPLQEEWKRRTRGGGGRGADGRGAYGGRGVALPRALRALVSLLGRARSQARRG